MKRLETKQWLQSIRANLGSVGSVRVGNNAEDSSTALCSQLTVRDNRSIDWLNLLT